MRASELLKAVEEGKKIRSLDGCDKGKEYDHYDLGHGEVIYYVLSSPNSYEIVNPKRKIKLYRYTYHSNLWGVVRQSLWSEESFKVTRGSNDKLLKIEEKEIEVGE